MKLKEDKNFIKDPYVLEFLDIKEKYWIILLYCGII